MLYVLLVAGLALCAALALRAARLLASALWLAGASALLATLLYALGACEIAVIELSVGAGLVTVLLIYAIATTGDEQAALPPTVPRSLAWALCGAALLLLGRLLLPRLGLLPPEPEGSLAAVLWRERGLDTLLQIGLLFTAALGVVRLLAEPAAPAMPQPDVSADLTAAEVRR